MASTTATESTPVPEPKYKLKFATADQVELVHRVIECLAKEHGFNAEATWGLFDKLSYERRYKKTKREGRKQKPAKPKTALTAYNYFTQEHRNRVHQENPSLSFKDLSKRMGTMWNSLNKAERDRYEAMHQVDKERYNREKIALKDASPVVAPAETTSAPVVDEPKASRPKKEKKTESAEKVEATESKSAKASKPKKEKAPAPASEPVAAPAAAPEKKKKGKAVEPVAAAPVKTVDEVKPAKVSSKNKKPAAATASA